uniref:Uncharacterized protein n=1 Tax=Oryza rufipogon TaxID=4529 RepID=A0A0E0PFX8_ORYRU
MGNYIGRCADWKQMQLIAVTKTCFMLSSPVPELLHYDLVAPKRHTIAYVMFGSYQMIDNWLGLGRIGSSCIILESIKPEVLEAKVGDWRKG